jgi:hypothetical protein
VAGGRCSRGKEQFGEWEITEGAIVKEMGGMLAEWVLEKRVGR